MPALLYLRLEVHGTPREWAILEGDRHRKKYGWPLHASRGEAVEVAKGMAAGARGMLEFPNMEQRTLV